jgi:hypothetical protein
MSDVFQKALRENGQWTKKHYTIEKDQREVKIMETFFRDLIDSLVKDTFVPYAVNIADIGNRTEARAGAVRMVKVKRYFIHDISEHVKRRLKSTEKYLIHPYEDDVIATKRVPQPPVHAGVPNFNLDVISALDQDAIEQKYDEEQKRVATIQQQAAKPPKKRKRARKPKQTAPTTTSSAAPTTTPSTSSVVVEDVIDSEDETEVVQTDEQMANAIIRAPSPINLRERQRRGGYGLREPTYIHYAHTGVDPATGHTYDTQHLKR